MSKAEEFYFDELKAKVGKGSGLYYMDPADGKYRLMIPAIEVPVPTTTANSIEIKVACASTVTKLESTKTIEEAEAPFYAHRDVFRILEALKDKPLHLLAKTGEHLGFKFDGTVSYTTDNFILDEAMQGTIKIIPSTAPVYVDDVYPLCKPTARFAGTIPANIELEKTTGTYAIAVTTLPEDATVTATPKEAEIATAKFENGSVTITGVKAGSTIVDIKVAKEGYADWTTSVHVIVPAA